MKPRANETTIITVGLLLFIGLACFFISRAGPTKAVYPPLSTFSPRPDGALALYDLLDRSGIKVERQLTGQYHYPEGGCVAVLSDAVPDPSTVFGGGMDAAQMAQWIRRGGRLIMFANPISFETSQFFEEFDKVASPPDDSSTAPPAGGTGASPKPAPPGAAVKPIPSTQPAHATLSTTGQGKNGVNEAPLRVARSGEDYDLDLPQPPLLAGVAHLEMAAPEFATFDAGAPLLTAGNPAEAVVTWLPLGKGELMWVAAPELASNAWIDRADNHRLLLALASYMARGGVISFDEYEHGYREQSASATGLLFQTPGGRLLLIFLGLCALAFAGAAVSPAHFMPPPVPPRRQTVEMVLAQANLYERAGVRRGVAHHLLDGLRQAVRRYEHLNAAPDDAALARWLHDAAKQGWAVDATLLQLLDGKLAIGTPQQLLRLAQACDKLREKLG